MRGPQICPDCHKPIEQGGRNTIAVPSEYPEGEPLPPVPAFHTDCFEQMKREGRSYRLCLTCGGVGVQEADELGRPPEHRCPACGGAGYVPTSISAA